MRNIGRYLMIRLRNIFLVSINMYSGLMYVVHLCYLDFFSSFLKFLFA